TALYQRWWNLGWVDRLMALGGWARSVWRRHSFVVGIDLRGRPPLPGRCPGPIRFAVIVLAVWSVAMAGCAVYFPADARALAVRVCYLGYLAVLIMMWSALILCIAVSALIPAAMIHDRFVSAFKGSGRRSLWPELSATGVYFAAV